MAHESTAQPLVKDLILDDVEPPFHVFMTPALSDALPRLAAHHRAHVLIRVERIAELASYGNLRGCGRFTVDSNDLLSSIDVIYDVDEPKHRVVFGTVEEPAYL